MEICRWRGNRTDRKSVASHYEIELFLEWPLSRLHGWSGVDGLSRAKIDMSCRILRMVTLCGDKRRGLSSGAMAVT